LKSPFFTASSAGGLGAGFDASALVQGAVKVAGTNNEIVAGTRSEQLLAGNYLVVDRTGGETIQMAGGGALSVSGSAGDTITGSGVSGSQQLMDLSGANPIVRPGAMTAIGGAGAGVVWAGNGDVISGGTGPMLVAGNSANNMKITGGAGDFVVFNLGKNNTVSGSTSGFTFIGDGYPGGGGNTIGGGASSVSGSIFGFTFPAGTVIIGGNGDVINRANGTMLVNALNGGQTVNGGLGAATVWAGPGGAVNGGPGAMQFNVGGGTKVTGGTGPLNAFFLFPGNTITGGSALGKDEIDRMMKEADAHREEASRLRELVDARNNAESLAYQIEKSLNENREKLDSSLASTTEGRIMELRGVLESGDVAEITSKTDALQESWTRLTIS